MDAFSVFKKGTKALQGYNIGAIPGLRPLHRFLYQTFRPKGIVETKLFGSKFFVDAGDMGEAHEILLHGVFSPYETQVFRDEVKPGFSIVDIGAHIGYFTVLAAVGAGEKGKVYAFEPDPKNFALLKKNIEANDLTHVTFLQQGLSDKAGKLTLFRDKKNLGNMSLSAENIPTEDAGGSVDVVVTTLDEYMRGKSVDFIKIDVQGAEALVLAGGKETFGKARSILLEFWPYGLKNMKSDPRAFLVELENLGFSFYLMNEGKHTMKLRSVDELLQISGNRPDGKGWANVLCRRER
jgi:FkbM family methyltransferase